MASGLSKRVQREAEVADSIGRRRGSGMGRTGVPRPGGPIPGDAGSGVMFQRDLNRFLICRWLTGNEASLSILVSLFSTIWAALIAERSSTMKTSSSAAWESRRPTCSGVCNLSGSTPPSGREETASQSGRDTFGLSIHRYDHPPEEMGLSRERVLRNEQTSRHR